MTLTASQRPSLSGWRRYLRDLWSRKDFAVFLIKGNLTARNASTALGLFWWVLNPLFSAFVYYVVFGLILRGARNQEDFLSYLVVGVFAFQYMTAALNGGSNLIQQNSRLLVNVRFPRLILPLAAVAEALVGFLTSLIAVVVINAITGHLVLGTNILWLAPALGVQTVFNIGLAALAARWVVPIRDLGNLIPHLTRFWFYVTPIIWGLTFLEGLPDWARLAIRANPMYGIIAMYRTAFLGYPVVWADVAIAAGWAMVVGVLGVLTFVRNEGTMVRYL